MSIKPVRKTSNPHLGSDFDDFLREEGLYDEAQAVAVKRVLAFELERGMVKAQLTKTAMAKRMGTTRAQLDRLLNPDNPATTLQTCIVHLIRNSLDYASWKDRKPLAAAIKPIYTAASAEAALAELDAFERGPWARSSPPSRRRGAGPGTA